MKLKQPLVVLTKRGCPLFRARDTEEPNNCINCENWPRPLKPTNKCGVENKVKELREEE